MVQFTPFEDPKPKESMGEYFGYTKEPGPVPSSKVASSILEGINDFGSLAIKALDTTNKIRIDDELYSSIKGEKKANTDTGLDLLSDVTKPQEQQYAEVPLITGANAGGIQGKAMEPVPPSIEAGIDRMNKLSQATKQGKFDDIAYYGNMQQIAQNLISRYPGYAQYITDKTAHFVGTDPANAQRTAVQATLAQLLNTKNSAADQWTKYVDAHAKYLGDENAVRAAYAANDPVAQNNFRVQIGKAQAVEHNLTFGTAKLNAELTAGKVTEERMMGDVHANLSALSGHIADNFIWNIGGKKGNLNDLNNMISRMQASGSPDPEVLQQIGLAAGQLKDAYIRTANEWYNKKQYNSQLNKDGTQYFTDSPATVLKNSAKWQEAVKSYSNIFDEIGAQAGAGNLHLATTDATTLAAMGPNQALRMVGSPVFKNYMGMEAGLKQSASSVINGMETTNEWKGRSQLINHIQTLNTKAIASGTDKWKGFMDGVQQYERAATGDQTAPPEAPVELKRGLISNTGKMIIRPDMPLEVRTKAAEYIANDQTVTFINTFKDKDRPNAWAAIYAPDVTKAIKTTMSDVTWKQYRSVGEQAFGQVFQAQIELLKKQAQPAGNSTNYRWNEDSQQIESTNPKTYRNNVVKTEVDRTIDNINTSLRTASNLLAADGEKITQEWLKKVGVNLTKTETPADSALKPLRMAGISPSGLGSTTAGNRNNAPVTSVEPPRATLDAFLASKSSGDQTPIYHGDTLVKNPQDVYKNAVEYKGEYFVRKDNKWFKIILPTK